MRNTKLANEALFDFDLYGISCVLKEYKLAWNINKLMHVQLIKMPDMELKFVDDRRLLISNFLYETENAALRLIRNKSLKSNGDKISLIIPELPHFDYLLTVKGFDDTFTEHPLKKRIMMIDQVQYVQKCDLSTLKSRDNLIF